MNLNLQLPPWAQSPAHFVDQLSWVGLETLGRARYTLAQRRLLGLRKPQLCRRCFLVAFVYSRAKPKRLDFRFEYLYRDYADLLSRQDCIFCAFITKHLGVSTNGPAEKYQWFSLHIFRTRDTCYLGVYGGNDRPQVTSSFGWARGVFDLSPEHYHSLELRGSGETVAVDFVKDWLVKCETDHRHNQATTFLEMADASPSRATRKANLFLVDVQQQRLVRADSSSRYVALSYVWGAPGSTINNFETRKATLNQLLVSLADIPDIPVVVRDAMQFVAAVGEQYLWVDRLCIVQDDAANKHENINQMDRIYANAVFTIVASSCISGNDPLPGVRSGTRIPQVSELAGGVRLKRGSQGRDFVLSNSIWDTRGWTFQEMHLSRRRVIFTAHEVLCECADTAMAELDLGEAILNPSAGNDPLLYLNTGPDFSLRTQEKVTTLVNRQLQRRYTAFGGALLAYRSLVREYTRRRLSFDSDILNAFTGILSHLTSVTGWGFAFGLPTAEFGLALLWLAEENAVRRTLEAEAVASAQDLPTWSWIVWRTRVFWLRPVEQMEAKDTRWAYTDRVQGYSLAYRKRPQESRPLPTTGESYPPNIVASPLQGLLCFQAEVLPASHFTMPDFGPKLEHLGPILISDAGGVYCGSMFMTSLHDVGSFEPAALSFVALSTFQFYNAYSTPMEDVENGPPMFLRNKHPLGNGTMVNGLLVRAVEGVVERVAVFQIDIEVWDAEISKSQTGMKTIHLA